MPTWSMGMGDIAYSVSEVSVGYLTDPVGVVLVEPDRAPVGEEVVGERQWELRVRGGGVERPVAGEQAL